MFVNLKTYFCQAGVEIVQVKATDLDSGNLGQVSQGLIINKFDERTTGFILAFYKDIL